MSLKIPFYQLRAELKRVLLSLGFTNEKAELCAGIFAENSRDGVYSHGLNRFPVFVQSIKDKLVNIHAEPEAISKNGVIENWDGHLAPGMYTATLAMQRAVAIAKENAMGCVAVKNTNHWMRGGTYGWQAADAGCVGICATNTIGAMPPWGGKEPTLGNNPMVIAVPRTEGHLVLDMAMQQFSYGKLQEYELKGEQLPVTGGYDDHSKPTTDPTTIINNRRAMPIGFWKGSALAFMLDVMISCLSNGRSTSQISKEGKEYNVSQIFICIDAGNIDENIINDIINYTKQSNLIDTTSPIRYPGEKTLATRLKNEKEGIPVNEKIWREVLSL